MEYRRFDDKIVARIDKGEEIVENLALICEKEGVKLGYITAIGAVNRFTAGVFSPAEKTYASREFCGDFEIVSLTGTATCKKNKEYLHLHMSAGDESGKVFGGHLNRAYVSATCEAVIFVFNGEVGREFSCEVGLNLFKF